MLHTVPNAHVVNGSFVVLCGLVSFSSTRSPENPDDQLPHKTIQRCRLTSLVSKLVPAFQRWPGDEAMASRPYFISGHYCKIATTQPKIKKAAYQIISLCLKLTFNEFVVIALKSGTLL